MEFLITLVTLGVCDLQRTIRFYPDGLGLAARAEGEDSIAISSPSGVRPALSPLRGLAEDVETPESLIHGRGADDLAAL